MIRKVERADLPVCVDVIRRSFQTVADEFGFTEENAPRFTAFATTSERLAWHMDAEHRLMYLDEEDGTICGYYSLRLEDPGECELGSLCVLPEYRHRGVGSRLLLHSLKTAAEQHCTVVKLSIVEENTVLRKWYERNGAIHTGTEKFDFFPFICGYMRINLTEGPEQAGIEDAEAVSELACKLWPNNTPEDLAAEFRNLLAGEEAAVFLYRKHGRHVGFAQCQLRHDYVEGTKTSPVGYLEGIYVREADRQQGIARMLLKACEDWAKAQGCTEFASDCEITNLESQAFHQAVGFREANRIVSYVRRI